MAKQPAFEKIDPEKQKYYEKKLIKRHGERVKPAIEESQKNMKNWTPADWQKSQQEFDAICKSLSILLQNKAPADDPQTQQVIARHHAWLKKMWTPTRESYIGLGKTYASEDFGKAFAPYHVGVANYFAHAMEIYAQNKLT